MSGLSERDVARLAETLRAWWAGDEIVSGAEAIVPVVAAIRDEAKAEALAPIRALAERWEGVLNESKAIDPRWILDRSVTTLDTALRDLRYALLDGGDQS